MLCVFFLDPKKNLLSLSKKLLLDSQMSAKIKKRYLFLTLVSSVIVLTDFYSRFLTTKALTPTEGARLIPQEALASLYIPTNSQDWEQIEKSIPPEGQSLLENEISAFSDRTTLKEISYQQDIQPWIGNIMLAFLPKCQFESDRDRKKYLSIVGIKNKVGLLKFANKLKNSNNVQIASNNYLNIPIVEITHRNGNILYLAILKNQLLLSPSFQSLKSAINTQTTKIFFNTKEPRKCVQ